MDRKNLTTVNITYSIVHIVDVILEASAWILYIIGYLQYRSTMTYTTGFGLFVMVLTAIFYIWIKATRCIPALFVFISEIVYKCTGDKNSEIPLIFNVISQLLNIPLQGIIILFILITPNFDITIIFLMIFNMLLSVFDTIIFIFNLEELIKEETTKN